MSEDSQLNRAFDRISFKRRTYFDSVWDISLPAEISLFDRGLSILDLFRFTFHISARLHLFLRCSKRLQSHNGWYEQCSFQAIQIYLTTIPEASFLRSLLLRMQEFGNGKGSNVHGEHEATSSRNRLECSIDSHLQMPCRKNSWRLLLLFERISRFRSVRKEVYDRSRLCTSLHYAVDDGGKTPLSLWPDASTKADFSLSTTGTLNSQSGPASFASSEVLPVWSYSEYFFAFTYQR